uniref:Reverse transcriptase domain-containing protein n=1 Tax=Tanacetum cinerariifolium TaxID=118510 RepID=A0A6L2KF69_TANCI|nr:hypothetical protein [Tanacetum cinerariifolium]
MCSSPHSTIVPSDSDFENTFSSTNILNYFLASTGNISPDSSNNFTKYILDILVFSPLHNDLNMEVIQAYDAIPPPQDILPKDTETPVESPIPVPPSSSEGSSSPVRSTTPDYLFDESIFVELDNSMPPKRTSTSAVPAMNKAAIRQLIDDCVATALEAQAANMENIGNTNRNPKQALVARKCSYKEFMS